MDNAKYEYIVYAIIDNLAKALLGGLHLHKHEASAVRFFADVASMPESMVGRHPQDYDLVQLGFITNTNEIERSYKLVLKGSVWAAATLKPEEVTH